MVAAQTPIRQKQPAIPVAADSAGLQSIFMPGDLHQDDYTFRLGEHLRNFRVERGWSLHAASHRTRGEFSSSSIGSYERGERTVSIVRLRKLARYYGVPVQYLLPDAPSTPAVDQLGVSKPDMIPHETMAADQLIVSYLQTVLSQRETPPGILREARIRSTDIDALTQVLSLKPAPPTLRETSDSEPEDSEPLIGEHLQ